MNILVTGRPGTGKSTLIRKVIEGLGVPAGGFVTAELRQTGMRVGFEVRDLSRSRRT